MDVSSNADGSLCGNRFDGIFSSFNFRSAHLPKHQIGLKLTSAVGLGALLHLSAFMCSSIRIIQPTGEFLCQPHHTNIVAE